MPIAGRGILLWADILGELYADFSVGSSAAFSSAAIRYLFIFTADLANKTETKAAEKWREAFSNHIGACLKNIDSSECNMVSKNWGRC